MSGSTAFITSPNLMDGPNIEKLFVEMQCLNGTVNLKEIVNYLRFFKTAESYQGYLKHYLPMLPKQYWDEFFPDLVTTDEIKASIVDKHAKNYPELYSTPKVEVVEAPAVEEKPKKKAKKTE